MNGTETMVAITVAAVAVGVVLGVPLGRWQLEREGKPHQRGWALLGGLGAVLLLRLADSLALPLAVFLIAAGTTSVVVIRRELARQGRV